MRLGKEMGGILAVERHDFPLKKKKLMLVFK